MMAPGANCLHWAAHRRSTFVGGQAKSPLAVCRFLAAAAAEQARAIAPVGCRRLVAPVGYCRRPVAPVDCCRRLRGAAQMSQPPRVLGGNRSPRATADSRLAARANRRSPVAHWARYCLPPF